MVMCNHQQMADYDEAAEGDAEQLCAGFPDQRDDAEEMTSDHAD